MGAGITGPMLRAAGVGYDIRKVDGYGLYPRFSFRVPLGAHGDTYDRYMIRILEMRESIAILQQALRDIPEGPIMDPKAKLRGFRPKPGEAYGRIEGPKGEIGFYLISDGSAEPLPLPRAPTLLHQPHRARGPVPRPHRRRLRRDPRQHRHRPRGGRPVSARASQGHAPNIPPRRSPAARKT